MPTADQYPRDRFDHYAVERVEGMALTHSQATPGARRGTMRSTAGGRGYDGQAEFLPIDPDDSYDEDDDSYDEGDDGTTDGGLFRWFAAAGILAVGALVRRAARREETQAAQRARRDATPAKAQHALDARPPQQVHTAPCATATAARPNPAGYPPPAGPALQPLVLRPGETTVVSGPALVLVPVPAGTPPHPPAAALPPPPSGAVPLQAATSPALAPPPSLPPPATVWGPPSAAIPIPAPAGPPPAPAAWSPPPAAATLTPAGLNGRVAASSAGGTQPSSW